MTFALGILPLVAGAQLQGNEQALARNFFDQGLHKIQEGQCEAVPVRNLQACREARDLFLRAYRLDAEALGALRNLAQVEQSIGLLASAARHYRDLARKAPSDPRPARRAWGDLARNALTALLPRVPHLTVVLAAAPHDTQVQLDNEAMPAPAWGAPLELDPGPHVVTAQAPGCLPFEARLDMNEGENRAVRVELASAPAAPVAASVTVPRGAASVGEVGEIAPATAEAARPVAAAPEPVKAVPAPSGAEAGKPAASTAEVGKAAPSGAAVLAPWVVVGAGGLAIGAASALGLAAFGQYETACPSNRSVCSRSEFDKGVAWADWSTALFVAGGAMVTGGVIWYLVGRSTLQESPPRAGTVRPSAGFASIGLSGYFE